MRALLICLIFAACSVNPNAPGLDDGADPNQRAETTDAGSGSQVGADAGPAHSYDAGPTMVPPSDPPDCENDADCPEGDVCRSGECRALFHGCASSADCHDGAVCSTQSGICVESCERDGDCPEGTRCSHISLCLADCSMDDPTGSCPAGTICKENPRFADFPYCGLEEEGIRCGPGGTCPAGMGCNPETGRCDEDHACMSDRDCPAHQLCNQATGRCHDAANSCATDRDCPDELICHRVHRRCTPPDWCETHHECPGMEQCHPVLERCMNRCRTDRHCSGDLVCRESWCVEE